MIPSSSAATSLLRFTLECCLFGGFSLSSLSSSSSFYSFLLVLLLLLFLCSFHASLSRPSRLRVLITVVIIFLFLPSSSSPSSFPFPLSLLPCLLSLPLSVPRAASRLVSLIASVNFQSLSSSHQPRRVYGPLEDVHAARSASVNLDAALHLGVFISTSKNK